MLQSIQFISSLFSSDLWQVFQPKVERQVAHRAAQDLAWLLQKTRVAAGHNRGCGLREEGLCLWALRPEVRIEGRSKPAPE